MALDRLSRYANDTPVEWMGTILLGELACRPCLMICN